ncbi:FecR family protein [Ancylomarina sp. DW003]|nr:FecR family protein [Ancylomarina sp. DW003]MDE5422133.1 FecR family protein [Ancylomarina sp. DW003]
MMNQEDYIQAILAYLKDEASDEQIDRLQKWLALGQDNKTTYQNIVRTYFRLDNIQQWDKINSFAAQKKVAAKLTHKKKFPYWFVAASLIILLGLSPLFLLNDFTNEIPIAQTTHIEPGKKGAELILSNGKRVQIMNTRKLLKEQNGVLVQVDSVKGIIYSKELAKSKSLIYNTIKVARGQEFNLRLSDGTQVWLNAESELKYPVHFSADNRKVFLKGEAYFEVATNKDKAFIVNSFDQDVRVYGTKFNINAYDKNLIKTVLLEGCVGVKIKRLNKEEKMIPGDLLLANMHEGSMDSRQVDVYPYIAWKDGNFLFRNENLEEIMLRLERWYNVKVFFEDNKARTIPFIGNMKRYTEIDKLLYFIEKSSEAKFMIKDNVIIVRSK